MQNDDFLRMYRGEDEQNDECTRLLGNSTAVPFFLF